jgi:hypothetical protein
MISKVETLRKMTLLKRKSSSGYNNLRVRLRNEPYLIINILLAGVILLVFAYSGIFSPGKDDYPVACIHEKLTGEPCISCGLSHSFSLILRGRINEACQWNVYGLRVFLFFASQIIMRMAFSVFYLKNTDTRKQLIIIDCIGSVIIFLLSFWPFIVGILKGTFYS